MNSSFYFSYKPEQKVIKSIRIDTDSAKHGYPLVSGITFATSQVNENIRPAPSIFRTTPREIRCEDNSFFEKKKFEEKRAKFDKKNSSFNRSRMKPIVKEECFMGIKEKIDQLRNRFEKTI